MINKYNINENVLIKQSIYLKIWLKIQLDPGKKASNIIMKKIEESTEKSISKELMKSLMSYDKYHGKL